MDQSTASFAEKNHGFICLFCFMSFSLLMTGIFFWRHHTTALSPEKSFKKLLPTDTITNPPESIKAFQQIRYAGWFESGHHRAAIVIGPDHQTHILQRGEQISGTAGVIHAIHPRCLEILADRQIFTIPLKNQADFRRLLSDEN